MHVLMYSRVVECVHVDGILCNGGAIADADADAEADADDDDIRSTVASLFLRVSQMPGFASRCRGSCHRPLPSTACHG